MKKHHLKIFNLSYRNVNKYLIHKFGENDTNYVLDILGRGQSFLQTICLLPIWFSDSFNKNKITDKKLLSISEANLKAWIGYTLYDYLRDNKISKEKIPIIISIANICTQEALLVFHSNTKSDLDSKYLLKLFNQIDLFYIRLEQRKASKKLSDITFDKFCKEISDKSIAASASAFIVTPSIFTNKLVYKNILNFFTYYFTARQLSDDLDDFEKDLKLKILTPATILRNRGDSKKNMQLFIRTEIDKNLMKAKKSLKKIPSFDSDLFIERYVKPC